MTHHTPFRLQSHNSAKTSLLLPWSCSFTVCSGAVYHYSDCKGEKAAAGEPIPVGIPGKDVRNLFNLLYLKTYGIIQSHHLESIHSNG